MSILCPWSVCLLNNHDQCLYWNAFCMATHMCITLKDTCRLCHQQRKKEICKIKTNCIGKKNRANQGI